MQRILNNAYPALYLAGFIFSGGSPFWLAAFSKTIPNDVLSFCCSCGHFLLTCRLAAGLAAFTAIVGGAVYTQTSGDKFNVSKIAEGFGNSLKALLSPDNTNAAIYSFLSAGLGLYSLVLLFGSHEVCCFVHSVF